MVETSQGAEYAQARTKGPVHYVVGFAFTENEDGPRVVLIKKNKPNWQSGKWNGVGGKVEFGETSLRAMIREFKEETTVETSPADWRQYATMGSKDWQVDVFCAFGNKFLDARTNTPEQVVIADWNHINTAPLIPNLYWLIPMALQSNNDVSFVQAQVRYFSVSDVE
jgi:8-oxo-dGTP diphosphatase